MKANRDLGKQSDLLIIWVIGTTFGRTQMDPGISFHFGQVISHTQYACVTSIRYCIAKNMADLVSEESAKQSGLGVGNFEHNSVFFCRRQGVTQNTVNIIDI